MSPSTGWLRLLLGSWAADPVAPVLAVLEAAGPAGPAAGAEDRRNPKCQPGFPSPLRRLAGSARRPHLSAAQAVVAPAHPEPVQAAAAAEAPAAAPHRSQAGSHPAMRPAPSLSIQTSQVLQPPQSTQKPPAQALRAPSYRPQVLHPSEYQTRRCDAGLPKIRTHHQNTSQQALLSGSRSVGLTLLPCASIAHWESKQG